MKNLVYIVFDDCNEAVKVFGNECDAVDYCEENNLEYDPYEIL